MIHLSEEIRTAITNAMADRCPMLVASVDAGGQPDMSYRGSTQVYADDALAIWIRDPESSGFLHRIAANPHVALFYGNLPERRVIRFQGRAHVDDSLTVRTQVYENSAEPERVRDPERKGKAVIVELDRVIFRGEVMER